MTIASPNFQAGAVPSDWVAAPLAHYIERPEYGFTDSASDRSDGPKFLRITDIQDGQVDWVSVPYCACPNDVVASKSLCSGDIVVARIGATTGKSFFINVAPKFTVFASYLIRLRTKPDALLPKFLHYYMQTREYWAHIDLHKGDRLKGGVNIPILESLSIVVPPLGEQQRIVHVLDRVRHACDANARCEHVARELKAAAVRELFTHGLHNELSKETAIGGVPASWVETTLGALCAEADGLIQTGPFGSQLHANEYEEAGVPVINPTHLDGNRIAHENVPRVSPTTASRLARHRVETGDILFARRGEVGRHGLVRAHEAGWICGTGCFLVRMRDRRVDPAFLSRFRDRAEGREP